jgi:hypothetical protein
MSRTSFAVIIPALAVALGGCGAHAVVAPSASRSFAPTGLGGAATSDPSCGWLTVHKPGAEDALFYCCAGPEGKEPRCRESRWH